MLKKYAPDASLITSLSIRVLSLYKELQLRAYFDSIGQENGTIKLIFCQYTDFNAYIVHAKYLSKQQIPSMCFWKIE
jgi:hypothetical protein